MRKVPVDLDSLPDKWGNGYPVMNFDKPFREASSDWSIAWSGSPGFFRRMIGGMVVNFQINRRKVNRRVAELWRTQ